MLRLDQESAHPTPAAPSELLCVTFNQSHECFAAGTDDGFRIYNLQPFKQTYRREFTNGGIGIVEMLFRCNILALVGGGRKPRYPPNKVMIWDDHQNRCIGELSFRSEVKAVRMSRERVVVVLEYRVYVYNFADLNLLHTIETISNPRGLIALCVDARACVLACCGLQKGHVRVELFDIGRTTLISAHEGSLACMALNRDGTRLATASERGTLIRVWDVRSGERLYELRRGAEPAEIQCLCFHPTDSYLLVGSDHGTVHVFKLGAPDGSSDEPPAADGAAGPLGAASAGKAQAPAPPTNQRSSFSFLTSVLPKSITPTYIQSQWSFAQYRLPGSERAPTRTVCAFGPDDSTSFYIVSADGTFFKCSFDAAVGGECIREDWQRYLIPEDDE